MGWLDKVNTIGWIFFYSWITFSVISITFKFFFKVSFTSPIFTCAYILSLFGTAFSFIVYLVGSEIKEKFELRKKVKELEKELEEYKI